CENSVPLAASDSANYFGAAPGVSIEKDIVCPDDGHLLAADTKVNLLKDSDGKVTYKIIVTNTGNVDLTNPIVTDSVLTLGTPTQTGGSGDHTDNILQVGETWTYTVDATWLKGGPNTNTADVSASFTDSATNPWTDDPKDSAIYFGLAPSITLTKLTNGADGA